MSTESFLPRPHPSLNREQVSLVSNEVKKWQETKQALLESFSHESGEIDSARVEKYIRSKGLPIRDYVFLSKPEDLEKVLGIFAKTDYSIKNEAYETDWLAMCDNQLDLVLIQSNDEWVKNNGSFFNEQMLVHELGHGSSEHSYCIINDTGRAKMARTGQSVGRTLDESKGAFFEEGLVESLAGEYTTQFQSPTQQRKIAQQAGAAEYDPDALFSFQGPGQLKAKVPYKYLHLSRDGIATMEMSPAAYSVELLCKSIPGLKEALFKARQDVEGLREVAKLVDSLVPGLYPKLRELKYNFFDFAKGQQMIVDALNK